MRRFVEVAAGLGTVAACIALYCWVILGAHYSVRVCSAGACSREHQNALEHDPALLAFAGVSLILGLGVGVLAVAHSFLAADVRPAIYIATCVFVLYNFVFLFTFGAFFAPAVPVLVLTCVAAAFVGHPASGDKQHAPGDSAASIQP